MLDAWLDGARHSGIRSLQQFAGTPSRDLDAENAIAELWRSVQAEGQINRLKALMRAATGKNASAAGAGCVHKE